MENKKKSKSFFCAAVIMLVTFAVWTVLVRTVDVRPVGPQDSKVGFATVNAAIHRVIGVNMNLYTVTDWLGLVPIGFAFGFGVLGFIQLIRRRSLLKVDRELIALGGFYIAVMLVYVFFELVPINYRPVLINGCLEVSYPSSTTLLTLCVMPSAILMLRKYIKNKTLGWACTVIIAAFTVFMVVGRVISGVHWFSDIVGGALVSGGLISGFAWLMNNE